MPHPKLVAWATGLLLALPAAQRPAAADGIGDARTLTPDALVAAVESSNSNIAAIVAAAEAAASRLDAAGVLDDPMLAYSFAPSTIGSDVGIRKMTELRQTLPWPGTRALERTVAETVAGAAAEDVDLARLDAVAAAHSAFAEWYFVHRAIEINAASQVLLAELSRVASARLAAGSGLQQDIVQAELERALLEDRRLNLERERAGLRARINALLTRAAEAPLPPPSGMPAPLALPALEAAREAAAGQHPHLRHAHHALARAQAEAALAEKAFFPDFSVSVGYNDMWDEREMRTTLGVSINVPLGRDRRRAELDAARADIRSAEHALADRRAEILAAFETAYAQAEQAIASIRLHEERLLRLAQDNLDAAVADYRSGAGQFLSVVTAERQLLSTQQGYERARADHWRARAELQRAVGGPLPDALAAHASGGPDRRARAHIPTRKGTPESSAVITARESR